MPTIVETSLDNGLKVILKEVHTAPVVSTWIWYRVGSRNEVEGLTGLSHWVEHMMFKGSKLFAKGEIMRLVERQGGYANAMTSYDFTTYYETLPSRHAELALQIEADRMLGATFDPAEVEAERTVIIAERENSENEPHYVLGEEMSAVAFRLHPYHHRTIGWKEDLLHITRDHLYAHYRRFYIPNNAILVIVGDIDPRRHLEFIKKYFGDLPSGELPQQHIRQEPPQRGERRLTVRMPGSAPLVRVAYHTPPVAHPDFIPLVVLEAVLSGGRAMFSFGQSQARSARLYRALVETQLAASVGSLYHPSLDPYLFTLGATVRQGRSPEEIEAALLAEITRLQEELVAEQELRVAIRQTQAQFAYNSESVTDQALTLGFLEIVDHHQRIDSILDELAQVTPEDIRRVAQKYLTEENRVVGWFLPTDEGGSSAEEHPLREPLWGKASEEIFFYRNNASSPIGPETVTRRVLDNGLVVLIKENPASASVTIQGDVQAGAGYDPQGREGMASFTAAMLRRGTRRHTYQELNIALDSVGAILDLATGHEEMSFSGHALAEDFELLMELLAEILLEPTFPEEEMEKLRGQFLTHLGILEMDTSHRAERAFLSAIYPSTHPYARPVLGTQESLRTLSREELFEFHRRHYRPERAVLSIVGAISAEHALHIVANTLGHWKAFEKEAPSPLKLFPVPPPSESISRRIEIPGKSQVDLVWGVLGMSRTSPDYYPAMMANMILGHLGLMGRLGKKVRDTHGLAYYVTSVLQPSRGPRPWTVNAGVHPDNIERALETILEEVQRLREEPVSDEELEDCRSYLTGALPLHLETNEGIASFLLTVEEYALGLDYLQRYPDIIYSVSKKDIQQVAQKYLDLQHYVLTMAGTFH
ncbi:MAG: insulinase family protein [Anaerolineae bacterium]|nr:insulinase family protein [Anaerolineae bacterium]